MDWWELVLQAALLLIGGGIGWWLKKVDYGHKEAYEKKERQRKHKSEVARKVHDIVVEASASRFLDRPKDMVKIYGTEDNLKGVEPSKVEEFNIFIGDWSAYSSMMAFAEDHPMSLNQANKAHEQLEELRDEANKLSEWSNNIRNEK